MCPQSTYLALDTGSTRLAVAVGDGDRVCRLEEVQTRSSVQLPRAIEGLLQEAGSSWRDLDGVVAAAGPGSFTGLRVGLAFALGLHQVLDIPATAVSTLQLLATGCDQDGPVTAAINAWRDSWFVQPFTAPPRAPTAAPERVSIEELRLREGVTVCLDRVAGLSQQHRPARSTAEIALSMALTGDLEWDAATLQRPVYLAPAPAVLPAGAIQPLDA